MSLPELAQEDLAEKDLKTLLIFFAETELNAGDGFSDEVSARGTFCGAHAPGQTRMMATTPGQPETP